MRIAQIQTCVYEDKNKNIEELSRILDSLDGQGIDMVTLGEMFNCPYITSNFPIYAEPEGGETWCKLSELAKKHNIYLSAGSVPEDVDGNTYNTAYVFDRKGNQIGKHRKVHLFDIDIKGGQVFKESDTLTRGESYTVFDTEFGKVGVCICFDCRFPELARLMVLEGAEIIVVPAAFNMTTGPLHWEIMFRSRAIDNQCFVVGTSPARNPEGPYVAWGHSMVVDPWGTIVSEMDEKPGVKITDIDLNRIAEVRAQLPLLVARRTDMYQLKPVE